jgi:hypothetical protein
MIGNWIRESTATTGTGTLTLSAVSGYERFSDVFATPGTQVFYVIQDGNNREIGLGSIGSGHTLSRDTIIETYDTGTRTLNPGTGLNLSGSAVVYNDIPATYLGVQRRSADALAANPQDKVFNKQGDMRYLAGAGVSIDSFSGIDHAGQVRIVLWAGINTLVHNTKLQIPGSANLTTASGDVTCFMSLDTTNVQVLWHTRYDGQPIARPLLLTGGTLTGGIGMAGHTIADLGVLTFNQEYDKGNSGTGATIDFAQGNAQKITLNNDTTLTLANAPGTGWYQLKVVQDATGGRSVTWAGTNYSASRTYGQSTDIAVYGAAGGETIVKFYWDGAKWYQEAHYVGHA